MKLGTPIQVYRTPPKTAADLMAYVEDKGHSLSVSADIADSIAAPTGPVTKIAPGIALAVLRPPGAGQDQAMDDALLDAAKTALPYIQDAFPLATGPIEAFEFCLSSKKAYHAFTDPHRTSLAEPAAEAGMAMLHLANLVCEYVPAVKNNHLVQAATLILKIGGEVYQINSDVEAGQAAKQGAFGVRPPSAQ